MCLELFLHAIDDYIGRSILVLKRHAGTLSELSGEEWTDLYSIIAEKEPLTPPLGGKNEPLTPSPGIINLV